MKKPMSHITITWADLARIKKAAKAAKSEHPLLSHPQRINLMAANEYGVRDYHELLQIYRTTVDACLIKNDEFHRCRLCGLEFNGDSPEDIKAHFQQHAIYEEAQYYLGSLPGNYAAREHTKKLGYAWMHSDNFETQKLGARAILLAHFERSLDEAIRSARWRSHPFIEEYIQCALADAPFIAKPIRDALIEEYGVRPGVLPLGGSYWPADVPRQSIASNGRSEHLPKLREMIASRLAEAVPSEAA